MAQVHSKYLRYKIGHNLKARHKGNKLTGQGERGNKRDKKVEKCKMRTKGGNKWGGVQIGKKRGLRKGRRLMSRLFPADPRAEFTYSAGLRGGGGGRADLLQSRFTPVQNNPVGFREVHGAQQHYVV